jgi:hypothetical protein
VAGGWLVPRLAALVAFAVLAGAAASRSGADDPGSRSIADHMRALSSLAVPAAGDLAFFDHGGSVGEHVYVGATVGNSCPAGVRIVDVRDPRRPKLVATAGGYERVLYEDLEVRRIGNRVVLVVGLQPCARGRGGVGAGIGLFDVTDPAHPRRLGTWRSPWRGVHELDVVVRRDGRALALVSTPHSERDSMLMHRDVGGDWRIIDITDPTRPRQLSDWGIIRDSDIPAVGTDEPIANPYAGVGGYAVYYGHSVRAADDGMTAYVSYWDAGVLKFDIRDPRHPRLVGRSLVGPDEEGDVHSVALLRRDGRRFVLASHEEVDPHSPPRVTTSATKEPLPAVELSWAPTDLAASGPISAQVADAGKGCTAAAFAKVRGKIALVDEIDASVPLAGKPLCDPGRQVVLAANAGARALLVNVTTGTRATIFRFLPASPVAVERAAQGMPVVAISSLDGGAHALREQLRRGRTATASLAATPRRWGGLALYDDERLQPAPAARAFASAGEFDDVPGIAGGGNGRPIFEGGTWYTSHNIELRGARAYVSWYSGGVVAIDVSDAPRLRRVGQFAPASSFFWGVDVDPAGQTVFATDRNRLWVIQPLGVARS